MPARGFAVLLLTASLAFGQVAKSKAKATVSAKTPAAAKKQAAPKAEPVVNPARTVPPPKDESARDKTLGPFLVRLKDVLKRKDRAGLTALLSDDIGLGIRGMDGPSAFYTAWGLTAADSPIYGVLSQILSLNGVWVDEQFCAPYVGVSFPKDLDPSKHQVALNPDVNVRAEGSATSRVLATLSYEIVEVLQRNPDWTKVKTQAGVTGFIPIAYLYSPAGYRACFAKNTAGEWRIQSLTAGR